MFHRVCAPLIISLTNPHYPTYRPALKVPRLKRRGLHVIKRVASGVLVILVSAVVLASVINTPPHLRPFIKALYPVENSAFRRLVAETIYSFDPTADIQVGGEKIGPDGVRQIDVAVRSRVGSRTGAVFRR